MQEKVPNKPLIIFIRRIWTDPVLSKVISAAIIGLFVALWTVFTIGRNISYLSAIIIGLFVLTLWIICLFFYLKKRSLGQTFGTNPAKFPAYSKRIRRVAFAGVCCIPIISVFGLYILSYYKSLPAKKLIILVAEFDTPDSQDHRVTQNIYEGLTKAIKGYTDLQVQLLGEPISFYFFCFTVSQVVIHKEYLRYKADLIN